MLGLAATLASLLRFRARACVVLACVAAMLCTASIASANTTATTKTRVWDFSFAAPLNTCPNAAASQRTHLENRNSSAKLASASSPAAREAPQAARASSAAQGALLRAQLAAEQVAGAKLPQAITGYTKHGLNQAISRDGVGVSARAIMDAFKNPLSITGQSGGRFMLTGTDAVVVVNAEGKVVTTWATNAAGFRVVP